MAKIHKASPVSPPVFSVPLFREGLRRLSTTAVGIAILSLTASLLVPLCTWMHLSEEPGTTPVSVSALALCPALFVIALTAPLLVYGLFSFLHRRVPSDFFHALPYTRTCLFVSLNAALFTVIVLLSASSALVSGILWTACPYTEWAVADLMRMFAYALLSSLILSGCMLFSVTLTGSGGISFSVFLLLVSLPIILTSSLASVFDYRFYGVLDRDYLWSFSFLSPLRHIAVVFPFSPVVAVFMGIGGADVRFPTGSVLSSVLIMLLLFAVSGILFRLRPSESAGHLPPSQIQTVIRTSMALPFAFPFMTFFFTSQGNLFSLIVLPSLMVLSLFLYEILTEDRGKRILRSLKSLLYLIGVCVVFALTAFFALSVYHAVDVTADSIRTVQFCHQQNDLSYYEYAQGQIRLDDDAVIRLTADAYGKTRRQTIGSGKTHRVPACIRMKNGLYKHVYLYLTAEEQSFILSTIHNRMNDPETAGQMIPNGKSVRSVYFNIGRQSSPKLGKSDAHTLFRVFSEEYLTLTPEEKALVLTGSSGHVPDSRPQRNVFHASTGYTDTDGNSLFLIVSSRVGQRTFRDSYALPAFMVRTRAAMRDFLARSPLAAYQTRGRWVEGVSLSDLLRKMDTASDELFVQGQIFTPDGTDVPKNPFLKCPSDEMTATAQPSDVSGLIRYLDSHTAGTQDRENTYVMVLMGRPTAQYDGYPDFGRFRVLCLCTLSDEELNDFYTWFAEHGEHTWQVRGTEVKS